MKRHRFGKSEQGLTLVESMVALVIFSTIIVMATPPIIMSMASRIRSYRAQQAVQIAQGEIDKTRIIANRDLSYENNQWNLDKLPPDAGNQEPQDVAAPSSTVPTSSCSDPTYQATSASQMCYVSFNTDKPPDFAVQKFISRKYEDEGGIAFYTGVRVYSYSGVASGQPLKTAQASLGFSSGSTTATRPLAVLYEPIIRIRNKEGEDSNNGAAALITYCQFLGGSNCTPPTPSPSP